MREIGSRTLCIALIMMILLSFLVSLTPHISDRFFAKGEFSATIASDVTEGSAGDYVTVTGSGFAPNKDVTFAWGDQFASSLGFVNNLPYYQRPSIARLSTGEVHTDAFGNFRVQLQVPKLKAANYTVTAFDSETSAAMNFKINSRILLRNTYAFQTHGNIQTPTEQPSSDHYIGLFLAESFVGDKLALQLSGFDNGEPVEVRIGTTSIGSFNAGFGFNQGYYFSDSAALVPEMPSGLFTVTATGLLSGISATADFRVKPELFLARQTTPPPFNLGYPWLYSDYLTGGNFALGWYSSVNSASGSTFMFEATGLTGTTVQTVNLTYAGTTVPCTLSGVLTVSSKGSTQGILAGTTPFTATSPFNASSAMAHTGGAIAIGTILNVVIATSGTGASTFTFSKQLVASQANSSETSGNTLWFEGTLPSPSLHLKDKVYNKNELISTNLKALRKYWTSTVYASGTTVQRTDEAAIAAHALTLFNQASQPLSYVDLNGNSVWNVGEDVYQDVDNSATVTTGDVRINTVVFLGSTYWPESTVIVTDVDVGRVLTDFSVIQRPAYDIEDMVVLDLNGDSIVSAGDVRVSFDKESVSAGSFVADNNGFLAASFTVPAIPGGGKTYDVTLWNFISPDGGVAAGNSVTLQIIASLIVTAPTYQATKYVAEGYSDITLSGNGFFGAEQLAISVGGKHVTTSTAAIPDAYGVLSGVAIDSIPALAGGTQSIVAQGLFTAANNATADVFMTPALSVTPTTGSNLNPITSIAVSGRGFETGSYKIILNQGVNNTSVAAFTVVSAGEEAGEISLAFNLPAGIEGTHIIDVLKANSTAPLFYGKSYFSTDGDTRIGVSVDRPYPIDQEFPAVTVNPGVQLSPTIAHVGESVNIKGMGLQPSMPYYVWFSQRGTLASDAILLSTNPEPLMTNPEGTLTATFTIPESSGGERAVWLSTSNATVNIDPVTGSPVSALITINPSLTLGSLTGKAGINVTVSFSGLTAGNQYQLWWYKPEEATVGDVLFRFAPVQVPEAALPLASVTGAEYGNSTSQVKFTVPSTAENGRIYSVDLTLYGDRNSVLSQPVFFTVGKVASKISLSLTPTVVTEGESVAINGVIEPAMSVDIAIQITAPNGTSTTRGVLSESAGTFTSSFTPNRAGTWQVTATWNGTTTYAASQSQAATVTVKPIDFSWTYALTGIAIGLIALIAGLLMVAYYFLHQKKPTATKEPAQAASTPPTTKR